MKLKKFWSVGGARRERPLPLMRHWCLLHTTILLQAAKFQSVDENLLHLANWADISFESKENGYNGNYLNYWKMHATRFFFLHQLYQLSELLKNAHN